MEPVLSGDGGLAWLCSVSFAHRVRQLNQPTPPLKRRRVVDRRQVATKPKPSLEVVREAHQTAFTGLGFGGSNLNVLVSEVLFL